MLPVLIVQPMILTKVYDLRNGPCLRYFLENNALALVLTALVWLGYR